MTGLAAEVAEVLAAHELMGKFAPALPGHDCRYVRRIRECDCQHLITGCTGCKWTAEADGTQGDAHRAHVAAEVTKRLAEVLARPEVVEAVGDALTDALCESPVWAGRHIGELEQHLADGFASAALAAVTEALGAREADAVEVAGCCPGGPFDGHRAWCASDVARARVAAGAATDERTPPEALGAGEVDRG